MNAMECSIDLKDESVKIYIHGLRYDEDEHAKQACFYIQDLEESSNCFKKGPAKFLWQSKKTYVTLIDERQLPHSPPKRIYKRSFRRRSKGYTGERDFIVTEHVKSVLQQEESIYIREYIWTPKHVNTEDHYTLVTLIKDELLAKDVDATFVKNTSTYYGVNTNYDDTGGTDIDVNTFEGTSGDRKAPGALAKLTYYTEKLFYFQEMSNNGNAFQIHPINITMSYDPIMMWVTPYEEDKRGLSASLFQMSEKFGDTYESRLLKITTGDRRIADFSLSLSEVREIKTFLRDEQPDKSFDNIPEDAVVINAIGTPNKQSPCKQMEDPSDDQFESIEIATGFNVSQSYKKSVPQIALPEIRLNRADEDDEDIYSSRKPGKRTNKKRMTLLAISKDDDSKVDVNEEYMGKNDMNHSYDKKNVDRQNKIGSQFIEQVDDAHDTNYIVTSTRDNHFYGNKDEKRNHSDHINSANNKDGTASSGYGDGIKTHGYESYSENINDITVESNEDMKSATDIYSHNLTKQQDIELVNGKSSLQVEKTIESEANDELDVSLPVKLSTDTRKQKQNYAFSNESLCTGYEVLEEEVDGKIKSTSFATSKENMQHGRSVENGDIYPVCIDNETSLVDKPGDLSIAEKKENLRFSMESKAHLRTIPSSENEDFHQSKKDFFTDTDVEVDVMSLDSPPTRDKKVDSCDASADIDSFILSIKNATDTNLIVKVPDCELEIEKPMPMDGSSHVADRERKDSTLSEGDDKDLQVLRPNSLLRIEPVKEIPVVMTSFENITKYTPNGSSQSAYENAYLSFDSDKSNNQLTAHRKSASGYPTGQKDRVIVSEVVDCYNVNEHVERTGEKMADEEQLDYHHTDDGSFSLDMMTFIMSANNGEDKGFIVENPDSESEESGERCFSNTGGLKKAMTSRTMDGREKLMAKNPDNFRRFSDSDESEVQVIKSLRMLDIETHYTTESDEKNYFDEMGEETLKSESRDSHRGNYGDFQGISKINNNCNIKSSLVDEPEVNSCNMSPKRLSSVDFIAEYSGKEFAIDTVNVVSAEGDAQVDSHGETASVDARVSIKTTDDAIELLSFENDTGSQKEEVDNRFDRSRSCVMMTHDLLGTSRVEPLSEEVTGESDSFLSSMHPKNISICEYDDTNNPHRYAADRDNLLEKENHFNANSFHSDLVDGQNIEKSSIGSCYQDSECRKSSLELFIKTRDEQPTVSERYINIKKMGNSDSSNKIGGPLKTGDRVHDHYYSVISYEANDRPLEEATTSNKFDVERSTLSRELNFKAHKLQNGASDTVDRFIVLPDQKNNVNGDGVGVGNIPPEHDGVNKSKWYMNSESSTEDTAKNILTSSTRKIQCNGITHHGLKSKDFAAERHHCEPPSSSDTDDAAISIRNRSEISLPLKNKKQAKSASHALNRKCSSKEKITEESRGKSSLSIQHSPIKVNSSYLTNVGNNSLDMSAFTHDDIKMNANKTPASRKECNRRYPSKVADCTSVLCVESPPKKRFMGDTFNGNVYNGEEEEEQISIYDNELLNRKSSSMTFSLTKKYMEQSGSELSLDDYISDDERSDIVSNTDGYSSSNDDNVNTVNKRKSHRYGRSDSAPIKHILRSIRRDFEEQCVPSTISNVYENSRNYSENGMGKRYASVDSLSSPSRNSNLGDAEGRRRKGLYAGYSYLSVTSLPEEHLIIKSPDHEVRAKEIERDLNLIRNERRKLRLERAAITSSGTMKPARSVGHIVIPEIFESNT